jgi:rubredoxin
LLGAGNAQDEMASSSTCPKCQAPMVEGFVIDRSDGGRAVSTWFEGTPQKSRWTGVKLKGKTPIETATWRCTSCGFLESYAVPPRA